MKLLIDSKYEDPIERFVFNAVEVRNDSWSGLDIVMPVLKLKKTIEDYGNQDIFEWENINWIEKLKKGSSLYL